MQDKSFSILASIIIIINLSAEIQTSRFSLMINFTNLLKRTTYIFDKITSLYLIDIKIIVEASEIISIFYELQLIDIKCMN